MADRAIITPTSEQIMQTVKELRERVKMYRLAAQDWNRIGAWHNRNIDSTKATSLEAVADMLEHQANG